MKAQCPQLVQGTAQARWANLWSEDEESGRPGKPSSEPPKRQKLDTLMDKRGG